MAKLRKVFQKWYQERWRRDETKRFTPDLIRAYQATFGIGQGQIVLQDLMDNVYCQVYNGDDPVQCLAFNAQRAVIHDILVMMEMEIPTDTPEPTFEEFITQARNGE